QSTSRTRIPASDRPMRAPTTGAAATGRTTTPATRVVVHLAGVTTRARPAVAADHLSPVTRRENPGCRLPPAPYSKRDRESCADTVGFGSRGCGRLVIRGCVGVGAGAARRVGAAGVGGAGGAGVPGVGLRRGAGAGVQWGGAGPAGLGRQGTTGAGRGARVLDEPGIGSGADRRAAARRLGRAAVSAGRGRRVGGGESRGDRGRRAVLGRCPGAGG